MNIKDNIDKEVLSHVANEMNITEDLLIKVISADLHNDMVMVFSIVLGALFLAIFLGIISYFRFKKNSSDFIAEVFAFATGIIMFVSVLFFALSGGYPNQFEVMNNKEYAVVKEINRIYEDSLKTNTLKHEQN